METISVYLDNMFAPLPRNGQMLKLKQEMLATMEEKYYELKNEGRSENEAVGIVISEFGNIEELMSELGLTTESADGGSLPVVTEDAAFHYLADKRRSGLLIGIGVFLCMLGVALVIVISTLVEDGTFSSIPEDTGNVLATAAMLLLVAPAVGLFIYSGTKMERHKYLEGDFSLPSWQLRTALQQQQAQFARVHTRSHIAAVCLAILSPLIMISSSAFPEDVSNYSVAAMLPVIGAAVFLFIYYGAIKESYQVLLQTGEFTKEKKAENKVIAAVATIVWPLAVCAFLVGGFVFNKWEISWIIFPITGILFGAFCGVYSMLKKHTPPKSDKML